MSTIYLAIYRQFRYSVASVEVVKETANQYQIDLKTKKEIRGWMYLPTRINKSEHHAFATLREAYTWCLGEMRSHIELLEQQKVNVQVAMENLSRLIEVEPSE